MKKTNKNNNHKILNKNYIKGAISGALALTILCSGVGVAAYSAGADNTAQALGVQTESTVEAVKKASTTKEALKKLSKNETVYVIADANGAAKKIIVSDWLKGVDTKGKVKDVYRQVIHLKHRDISFLTAVREKLEKYIEINSGFRKIYIQFDMN